MTIVVECEYLERHEHVFPGSWHFGGADGTHPGADPRFKSTTYKFLDCDLNPVFTSSMFTCDEMALDYFTHLKEAGHIARYLAARRQDEKKYELIPWVYNAELDTLYATHPKS